MVSASAEYLSRRDGTEFARLSPLHHHVINCIFSEMKDGFCFDDVFQHVARDTEIVDAPSMAGNLGRVKLVVIRALDALVSVEMLNVTNSERESYHLCWTSDA